jgi:hypothetical protein
MSTISSQGTQVWKKLWKLQIPSNIKIFAWRSLHALIPCLGALANRHTGSSSQCQICNIGCEDILHMVFTCQGRRSLGEALHWTNNIECATIWSIRSFVSGTHDSELKLVGIDRRNWFGRDYILARAWFTWWERRQIMHSETLQPTTHISAMSIGVQATNYWRARNQLTGRNHGCALW